MDSKMISQCKNVIVETLLQRLLQKTKMGKISQIFSRRLLRKQYGVKYVNFHCGYIFTTALGT